MRKGLAGVIISLLAVLAVAFAILYINATGSGSDQLKSLRAVVNERDQQLLTLRTELADRDSLARER